MAVSRPATATFFNSPGTPDIIALNMLPDGSDSNTGTFGHMTNTTANYQYWFRPQLPYIEFTGWTPNLSAAVYPSRVIRVVVEAYGTAIANFNPEGFTLFISHANTAGAPTTAVATFVGAKAQGSSILTTFAFPSPLSSSNYPDLTNLRLKIGGQQQRVTGTGSPGQGYFFIRVYEVYVIGDEPGAVSSDIISSF